MDCDTNEMLIRNLKDAGCGSLLIAKMVVLHESGNLREQLRLQAQLRFGLLEKLHAVQKKVDCLDYLMFDLKQKHTTGNSRKKK